MTVTLTKTTAPRVTLSTDELRPGDVISHRGMRLLIDQPISVWQGHPGSRDGALTYGTDALVLNADEVRAAGIVPWGWLFGRASSPDDLPRWYVQGNSLARWSVQRTDRPVSRYHDTYWSRDHDETWPYAPAAARCHGCDWTAPAGEPYADVMEARAVHERINRPGLHRFCTYGGSCYNGAQVTVTGGYESHGADRRDVCDEHVTPMLAHLSRPVAGWGRLLPVTVVPLDFSALLVSA